MHLRRLLAATAVVAFAVSALPSSSRAAISASYSLSGFEVAATSTQGTFVFAAKGSGGDAGLGTAVVDHTTPLAPAATVTGGSFDLAVLAANGRADAVSGSFAPGGTIVPIGAEPGCGKELFSVSGDLTGVTTASGASGTGFFHVLLTHLRRLIFGRCLTVGATIRGGVEFTLTG